MPGTDVVTLRAHWLLWAQVVSFVLLGLIDPHGWRLLAFPVAALGAVAYGRARTTLAPDGITTCDGIRTRRLRWDEVESLTHRAPAATVAVARDGRRVTLANVRWDAVVPAEYVKPGSAQRVAQYAASFGHEVALQDSRTPART